MDKDTGYLFVDLETTGLDPEVHGIAQLAAIITDLQFRIQSVYMSYVNPDPRCEINPEALAINQIDPVDLECAPTELYVARAFQNFIYTGDRLRFAGYNCPFDMSFLAELYARVTINHGEFFRYDPPLDLLTECRKKFKKTQDVSDHKLTTMAPHLGIDLRGAHDALSDIHATVKIARKLLL